MKCIPTFFCHCLWWAPTWTSGFQSFPGVADDEHLYIECIPVFSDPRTRPPPVSCCTFFVFPCHWRGATAQCNLHSASPVGKSPKAQVTEEIPTPTESSAKHLCSAIVSSPRSKIFSVLSSPSSICVPEQPQKVIVNVHQRPIWNVGYPTHTAPVLHQHCSWSQLALDYFSETNSGGSHLTSEEPNWSLVSIVHTSNSLKRLFEVGKLCIRAVFHPPHSTSAIVEPKIKQKIL